MDFPKNLQSHLFWDTDINNLNPEKHTRFIIERVVTRGRLEDWFLIKNHYGIDRIKQEVVRIRSMDKKSLTFLSNILEIPKNQFRCSTMPQSIQKLWDY